MTKPLCSHNGYNRGYSSGVDRTYHFFLRATDEALTVMSMIPARPLTYPQNQTPSPPTLNLNLNPKHPKILNPKP